MTLSAFKSRGLLAKRSWEEYYRSLLVDPTDYYLDHFKGRSVFRYIQTHPDMDHMSGLCRFFWQEEVSLVNFWDTLHKKDFDEDEFDKSRYDWSDWLVYKLMQGGELKEGSRHKTLHQHLGDRGNFWTEDGLVVLGPTHDLVDYCNKQQKWNNSSYVLAVEFGGRRVILPGDAENPAWDSIEANVDEDDFCCDILKAAHHGRESGYSETAVDLMDPSIVICSVGKRPDTDASDEYRDHGADVLSTRYNGSITATIWADGEVWVDDREGKRIASLPIL